MKKNAILVISLIMAILIAGLLPGCSSNTTTTSTQPAVSTPTAPITPVATTTNAPSTTTQTSTAATRTITDMMGKSVIIPTPENIHRVAVLTSPQTIEMYIIGQQDKICAISNAVKQWTFLQKIDPRIKDLPAVRAQVAQINIESLLQSNPDFCIGSDMDMQVVEKNTSIPTLRVNTNTSSNFLQAQKDEVAFFGMVFGQEARAAKYSAYLDDTTSKVKTATAGLTADQRLKVFMGYNADHLTTFGGGTFMNEWIETAGCLNAAQSVKAMSAKEGGLSTVSMEQILSWNPDILVIDTGKVQDVYNDSNWANIPAVKNKKVYSLPVGMFIWSRASSEAAAMLPKWLSLTAYPDLFKDNTMNQELKRFFSDIIGYNLTDEDVNTILYPQGQ